MINLVTSPQSSQDREVRVGFFPNIGHAIPIVGLENEIFLQHIGDNVEINAKFFDSGPQVISAMFTDSIDMAYVGPGPAINGFLRSEKQNIVIISGAANGGASFVVHPDSTIQSAVDLVGKRVAAPQIANTQDISLRNYLNENGLKPADKGGNVHVINIANPDIYTLFTKGDVDAAWVPEPWATIFVDELGGVRLFYEEEQWVDEQFASVLLVARADYVQENPDIIHKWINAHKKTQEWINENPDMATKIFNIYVNREFGNSFTDKTISAALSNIEITSDPIKNSIDIFAQRADSLGYLGRHGYNLDGIFYNVTNLEYDDYDYNDNYNDYGDNDLREDMTNHG
jgi:NitT/TauT family transport system substrate-binding protein